MVGGRIILLDLLRAKGGASLYGPLIDSAKVSCLQLERVEELGIRGDGEERDKMEVGETNDGVDGKNGVLH